MVTADGPASHDQVDDALADPVVRDRRPTTAEIANVEALTGKARATAVARREKAADKKRDERNAARRKEYADAKPKPYDVLAGREGIARGRVIAEARARLMQLQNATAAPCRDPSLVKLRGREAEVVETWKTMQLLRVATKREATNRDVADNAPALIVITNADTRLRQANRLLGYFEKLEASGVWHAFDLLHVA